MSLKIASFGLSDVGLVRENNQDVWAELPAQRFFVLCDGMGGHQAGDVAAHEAVDLLCDLIKKLLTAPTPKLSLEQTRDLLDHAIQEVNRMVHVHGCSDPDLMGMGTTLCCLLFHDEGLVWGNVGDSRIYRLRNGKLEQLSSDHSLVHELFELGELTARQVRDYPQKNIITRAVGTEPSVDPSVEVTDALHSDVYLLCSDGLSDMITDEEIEREINAADTLEKAGQALVDRALQKGGHDNVTIVILNLEEVLPRYHPGS